MESQANISGATDTQVWHVGAASDVLARLEADPEQGLDNADARRRLSASGANEIESGKRRTAISIFFDQFKELMILILLGAVVASGILGELGDMLTIAVIVMLNAIIGATQEYRAQNAIEALRKLSALDARVIRDGTLREVQASTLVPGDIVVVEAGNIVPADLRLIDATELVVDESALTGESVTVDKDSDAVYDSELPIGDRRNMAYRSTSVTKGRARGVVVATGLHTEIGRIAELISKKGPTQTPLQKRLAVFARKLVIGVLAVCVGIFAIGLLQGQSPLFMLLVAISLAVAAIPESLPAVVTISLAIGARRLSRSRALIRRLTAVESLGSVTFICADKTGTLTENRMTVASIFADGRQLDEMGELPQSVARFLVQAMALCNDVADSGQGDPTEVALVVAAKEAGYNKQELLERFPKIETIAFDTDRKLMTTLHRIDGGAIAYVKGAPESVLDRCESVIDTDSGSKHSFDRGALLDQANELAANGFRVLAIAVREFSSEPDEKSARHLESDLTFVGLVALQDPIRPEVPQAIADCRSAGITPVIITGDHPATARKIASTLGLISDDGNILTGRELAELSDSELRDRVPHTQVYARVDPEQKIRIVEALQGNGQFVAMTGDGVNDAPALRQATIGVAMGQRGTEVARETADMVLLDDNFATIVSAIREGRRVYDNIRKFIRYTMTSNTGEIAVLLLAPVFGLPMPLLPIHILWINLVTDGLPGLAFSAEPAEADIMRRTPRPPTESLFARGLWQHMVWMGLLLSLLALGSTAWIDQSNVLYVQSMVFTTLVVAQLFQALSLRSESRSIFALGLLTNPYMISTIALTLIIQIAILYVPFANSLLHTTPLALADVSLCLILGSLIVPAVELQKYLHRRSLEISDSEATGS